MIYDDSIIHTGPDGKHIAQIFGNTTAFFLRQLAYLLNIVQQGHTVF